MTQSDAFKAFVASLRQMVAGEVERERGIAAINNERDRQDHKWGEQNHPLIETGRMAPVVRAAHAAQARKWREYNEARAEETTWAGILLEEVYEALSEVDPLKQEDELVQVAAVALAAWESLRRARNAHGEAVTEYFRRLGAAFDDK